MIENDLTRDPRPFVIVTGERTGGTWLAHCLDSHTDIICDRGEPLWHGHGYFTVLHAPDRVVVLTFCLTRPGYLASGLKVRYGQLDDARWAVLAERKPAIIHLTRSNYLRQAVSAILNRHARKGAIDHPQHAWETPPAAGMAIEPTYLITAINALRGIDEQYGRRLEAIGAPMLMTSYEALTGGKAAETPRPAIAREICALLGVPYRQMRSGLAKINPQPLTEIITNWPEVRAALLERPDLAKWARAEDS